LGEWDASILRDEIAGLLAEEFDLSLLGIHRNAGWSGVAALAL
jgi:hypothetical protein